MRHDGSVTQTPEMNPKSYPHSIAERCVHSLMETASCHACVDACPRDAWILDDDALALDLEACDGCSLCRPECPQGAIDVNLRVAVRTWHDQRVAMVACEHSGVEETEAILPCIHALGLQEILRLYGHGVTRLLVAMGSCDECPRGGVQRLDQRIASLNRSLQESGNPLFILEQKRAEEWSGYQSQSNDVPSGPLVSRRSFLRAFVGVDENTANSLSLFLGGEGELFDPPAQLLPNLYDDSILTYIPDIEPQRCTGCDACIRICPHQAIRLDEDDAGPAYLLHASQCTGCGMCVDVCNQEAVVVRHWTIQQRQRIPLRVMRCSACGVSFHEPAAADRLADSLCPICSQRNHHRNLYQVL